MSGKKDQILKWKSPLLLIVLSFLVFESLSGFILFFFGPFLTEKFLLVTSHWLLGIIALIPYAVYQWKHYFAVRKLSSQFHYKIGKFTFITVSIVTVSGIPLIFDINQTRSLYTLVDLLHIVSSFAFLILLSGHLVLVARVTLARIKKKVPAGAGTFDLIGRKIFWVPLIVSILALLLIPLLSNIMHN